ncbi:U3 small nucleolar RNA-associated protein [Histoplasma capsulatum var. duboisii H88]|uniref:U3 small nucleolar RNA-associated protein 11 n=1 Tax=Ajellomyces capsulatus (strain H88) TaxID=544711 RepID=F0UG56_AJEC8|nr:U3 small nucleolar RNA-associated protein [Histoplasma capsulatum var. duboisii H88]QSS55044.1 U3 small nucleolar RNA-associated protein [Histoplasma capsulatum var. duboisii H88]
MSSMRNAIQRRPHRERAQPSSREKWGILEKHKDYTLRARDYNVKKAKLQRLREKARDRNLDEFAFGMMSEKSNRQGRHGARGSEAASNLSHETIKLLKTQDAGYLRVVGEKVRRQLEGAEQEVRLQDGMSGVLQDGSGRKIVFANSLEEQRRLQIEKVEKMAEVSDEEEGEASSREKQKRVQRSKKQIEAEERARKEMLAARRLKKRAAEARRKKVEALRLQHKELVAAAQELDRQRAKMENSVGGVNKYGIKWKIRERKK